RWVQKHAKTTVDAPLGKDAELFAADIKDHPLQFASNEGKQIEKAPKMDAEKPFSVSVNFFFPKAEQSYVIAEHNNPKDKNRGWMIAIRARVMRIGPYRRGV